MGRTQQANKRRREKNCAGDCLCSCCHGADKFHKREQPRLYCRSAVRLRLGTSRSKENSKSTQLGPAILLLVRGDGASSFEMIKARSGRKASCGMHALHAELLGCLLAGFKAAMQLGMSNIVVETDALLVKHAVEGDGYRLSALGGVTTELNVTVRVRSFYNGSVS